MPISAFWCASCAEVVDESHYAPWSPCESGITPGHVRNILTHAEGRPDSGWSVTQIKGCLRSVVIERTVDVTVNPADYLLMELGTAWDKHISDVSDIRLKGYGQMFGHERFHGHLGGLEVSGEPDGFALQTGGFSELPANGIAIWDYKNGTPPRRGVWLDHRWQVSVYAFISPYHFDSAAIYYNAYGGKAGTPCKRRFDLIRDEDALLAHEIYPGFTVMDNIGVIERVVNESKTVPEFIQATNYPLTGQNVKMGKHDLCHYCPVLDACTELNGGVGI